MSPESPQRPLAGGRDDHAISVGHAVCSSAVCCQPPAHGLARRVALESLLASNAEEATVTLSYLPGGDRPARVDLLLDGAPSAAVVVPRSFGRLESGRLHKLFVKAEMELTELARWGASGGGDAVGEAGTSLHDYGPNLDHRSGKLREAFH
jgi:hypothetical protein